MPYINNKFGIFRILLMM